MGKRVSTIMLGQAAEYAVAAELCRRGIGAQLTFGNQKRTDVLIFSESGKLARVEVKAKQVVTWVPCKGVFGANSFLVFVDYENLEPGKLPAFFVLNGKDWRKVIEAEMAEKKARNPKLNFEITKENVPRFLDQKNKASGKPMEGITVKLAHVKKFFGQWEKIEAAVR